MALYRLVSHEHVDEDGATWLMLGPETEETPCARCGGEAFRNICPGDGRYHHHGCVHTAGDKLEPVCKDCIQAVDAEWTTLRQHTEEIRSLPEAPQARAA